MAGTPQTAAPVSKQYVDYDEYVDFQLEKARNHIKATDIFTTLTTLAAAFIGYLLVFVVCDQWLLEGGFSDWARIALLAIVVAGLGTVLARRVIVPLVRRIHPLYAARMIEQADPELKSNLLNFVDIRQDASAAPAPGVLRAMEKRAAVELAQIDVDEAIDRRPLLRTAYALLGVVFVAAMYIVFSPKDPFASVKRALLPTASIAVATETTISDVTPGDDTVSARTQLTIEADVRGHDVDRVEIVFTTTDHKEVDKPVEMRRIDPDLPRFRGVLNGENGRGLLQSLTYAITAGDARTRDFQVNVIQPPSARVDEVQYTFPPYMELEKRATPGGTIDGWEGAMVTVSATANMPVKSAMLVMTDSEDSHANGEEVSLEVVDGTKLTARWKLEFRGDGTCPRIYHIQVKTAKGDIDPDPMVHSLRIRADQRPEVALLHPTGDLVREQAKAPNAVIPLLIQAADPDFQLRVITLKVERSGQGEPIISQNLFEDRQPLGQVFRGTYDWNLGDRTWTPGETVQFWIEVRDTKAPKANRGVTPKLNLQIAEKPKTAEEVRRDLAADKQQMEDQIARADDANNLSNRQPTDELDPDDESTSDQARGPARPSEAPKTANQPDSPDSDEPRADSPRDHNAGNHNAGDREAPATDDKGEQGQRQPVGNENERALQKLLQREKNQTEQQQADRDKNQQPPEGDRQPGDQQSRDQQTGDKQQDGEKSKTPGKDGSDKTKAPKSRQDDRQDDPLSKPSQNDEPRDGDRDPPAEKNKTTKKDGAKNQTGKNSQKPGEMKQSGEKKEPGRETEKDDAAAGSEKPDKQPDPARDGKKNGTKPDSKKPADDKQTAPGKTERGDKQSEKKQPGKQETGNESSDDKPDDSAAEGQDPGKKQPNKTEPGKTEGGKKVPADTPDGDKPQSDKAQDDQPPSDGKKSDDEQQTSDGQAGKSPKKKTDPDSDGGGDKDDGPSTGDDAQSGKPTDSKSEQENPGDAADDPQSKPNSPSKERGKPTDPKDPAAENEPGEKEPADASADAKKKKGTGDEEGDATGSDEKDPDAVKTKKDQQRKPESKQGQTQKSANSSKPKQPGKQRKPEEGTSSATDDAEETERPADGRETTEQPGQTDDPSSEKPEKKNPKSDREKRPGQPPDAGNQPKKGDGRKGGQKSDQPETGEKGASSASDQGQQGGNKEGAGDKSDQPGDSEQSTEETGKPGDKPGKGSSTKPGAKGDKSKSGSQGQDAGQDAGKEGGKDAGEGEGSGESSSDSSEPGQSESPGKPGSKSSGKSQGGKPGGQSAGQPGDSSPSSSAGGGVSGPPSGAGSSTVDDADESPTAARERSGSESSESAPDDDEANLKYAREASNLLLKRLKKQLERGEIDQEMLDELGWKDRDDVANFIKFLEDNLPKQATDDSPEATAKRLQFEELLKGMRLGNETERREGGDKPERRVGPGSIRNRPVPPEYREQYEAYTKSLARQKADSDKKADARKPAAPKKSAR